MPIEESPDIQSQAWQIKNVVFEHWVRHLLLRLLMMTKISLPQILEPALCYKRYNGLEAERAVNFLDYRTNSTFFFVLVGKVLWVDDFTGTRYI